jgi:hypothetical protein
MSNYKQEQDLQEWQKKVDNKFKSLSKLSSPQYVSNCKNREDSRSSIENTSFNQNFTNPKSVELLTGLRPSARVEDILLREGERKKERIKLLEKRVYDYSYRPTINRRQISPKNSHNNVFDRYIYIVPPLRSC